MWNRIVAWIKKDTTSHAFLAIVGVLYSLYESNSGFQSSINSFAASLYQDAPPWLDKLILLAIPVIMKYWNSNKAKIVEAGKEFQAPAPPAVPPAATLKIVAALLIFPALLMVSGCKTVQTQLPTAPGSVNQLDDSISKTLEAAHHAVVQYDTDVSNGYKPSAGLKSVMSNITTALNVADPLYQQFHSQLVSNPNTTEPQELVNALATITATMPQIVQAATSKTP